MVFKRIFSNIDLSPLAPVFFFIAFSSVMSFLEPSNDVTWASEQIPILGILGTAPFWVSLAVADFFVKLSIFTI